MFYSIYNSGVRHPSTIPIYNIQRIYRAYNKGKVKLVLKSKQNYVWELKWWPFLKEELYSIDSHRASTSNLASFWNFSKVIKPSNSKSRWSS